jgi:hypothetical protein
LRADDLVERGGDLGGSRAVTAARGGMVVGHPREQIVLDALPAQPLRLCAHGERGADLRHGVDDGAARQRSHHGIGNRAHARLERGDVRGCEEGVDKPAPRCMLGRVDRIGHRTPRGRGRREGLRVARRGDDVGMPEERDATWRLGQRTGGAHAVVGAELVGEYLG